MGLQTYHQRFLGLLFIISLLGLVLAPTKGIELVKRIYEIQGEGHISPFNREIVTTVGVVTFVDVGGVYLQDAIGDDNPATSDAIRVITTDSDDLTVGDFVEITGTVVEVRQDDEALTLTTMRDADATILESNQDLPTPTIIGQGGRVPPNAIIEDDASGNLEDTGTYEPNNDGIDFYESLESMLVQINDALVVGPTNRFDEIWVVSDRGDDATSTTNRSGVLLTEEDQNPERIQLDSNLLDSALPKANVGDLIEQPVLGIVGYDFDNYRIHVIEPITIALQNLSPETTDLTRNDRAYTVAAYNIENFSSITDPIRVDQLAEQIVNALDAPDIIALQEIQDNDGDTGGSVLSAERSYEKLIDAIEAADGPRYAVAQIDPQQTDADGGRPNSNIRVGFLYNPDRVDFAAQEIDDPSSTPASVTCDDGAITLSHNPARIDPENTAFFESRKPLVAEFTIEGESIWVINVHFNSKGEDTALYGVQQPPARNSETQRHQQAEAVGDFVSELFACNLDAHVMIAGDLNDFEYSDTVLILERRGLNNLILQLPPEERYTYNYQGNAETLDHILVSDSVLDMLQPEIDIVHLNAEYHVDERATDHDPVLTRLHFSPAIDEATEEPSETAIDEATPEATESVFREVTPEPDPDGAVEELLGVVQEQAAADRQAYQSTLDANETAEATAEATASPSEADGTSTDTDPEIADIEDELTRLTTGNQNLGIQQFVLFAAVVIVVFWFIRRQMD